MGVQPSSARSRGSGPSPRSVGSVKGASFAPALEPIDTSTPVRGRTPPWVQAHGGHSMGSPTAVDLEAGTPRELQSAMPPSPKAFLVDVGEDDEDPQPSLLRRPSKMSVQSFGSKEESIPSMASQGDSRPTSSQGFGPRPSPRPSSSSTGGSSRLSGSRPASANSKLGVMKLQRRDPALVQAERIAKLSLERLEQQDFIAGFDCLQDFDSSPTPSTISPTSVSRASNSACGSRPASSAASVSSSVQGKDLSLKSQLTQLKDAQQRAKASSQALLSELKGSAKATPARYSTWPIGCTVKVAVDDPSSSTAGVIDRSEPACLVASLVSYDKVHNTFVVKLDDGSTRTVPAQRVTRARTRDRVSAPQPEVLQQAPATRSQTSVTASSTTASVHVPSGRRAQPLPLEWPQMPGQSLEAESPTKPKPQTLGRSQLVAEMRA